MSKIKVGVAGYGVIGQRLADGVARQGDMELVGVADLACGDLIGVQRAEWMAVKRAVVVHMKDILSVLLMSPRSVRSGVMDMEREGLLWMPVDEIHSPVSEEIGDIFVEELRHTVNAHVGMPVSTAAAEQHRPLVEALSFFQAVAHMPFSDKAHMIPG